MQDSTVIVGIDEAGRGALAGPVVAGACYLKTDSTIPDFIQDSKKLDEKSREKAYKWIVNNSVYGYGIVESVEVDQQGILTATERAMQMALRMIEATIKPTYLLIDGRDKFWFDYPHSSVIHGDELEPTISAGSIIAKVTRDRLMIQYSKKWKQYGFSHHKGYGTPEHIEAIHTHGVSPLHRLTFLSNIVSNNTTDPVQPVQLAE